MPVLSQQEKHQNSIFGRYTIFFIVDFEQVFAQTEYCLIIKTTNSIRYRRNFSKSKNSAQ